MLKHIVMLALKPENADENAIQIKQKIEELATHIPEAISIKVYHNIVDSPFTNCDVVLLCEFANFNDCVTYQNHPLHKEVLEWIKTVIVSRHCVEYEY